MVSFRNRLVLGGAILILLCGCQPLRNEPSPEELARRAAGVSEQIVFRSEPTPLEAADVGSATLSLPDAVRLALKNDPRIQVALSRVRIAQADARQSRLLPNPILDVAFRFPASGGRPVVEAGLVQDFVAILQKPGLIGAADDRLRAAGAEVVSAVLDVLAEVQEKYVSVQTLEEELHVLQERLALILRLHELASARLRAGEGTLLDVTTVGTQRIELETEIAERALERTQERLAVSSLIGNPLGEPMWKVTPWAAPGVVTAKSACWVEAAIRHRPDLQAKRWQLSALGAEQRVAWLSPFEGSQLGTDAERDEEWSLGPSLSAAIPVFDFGQARRERAQAAVLEAGHELTKANREVIAEVRKAHTSYRATQVNLAKVRDELVPLANQRLDQAHALYKAGEVALTDLLFAEQEVQTAWARLIGLERKNTVSLVQLERAVGGATVAESLIHAPGYDELTDEACGQ